MAGLLRALVDLVVPSACAGCGGDSAELTFEVCPACIRVVEELEPAESRPDPYPVGLPPVFALGEYGGPLRELIIGFKDRGRHRLARPLGHLLAAAVMAAAPEPTASAGRSLTVPEPARRAAVGPDRRGPILLMYVPDTGSAARERHGDHIKRLAESAAMAIRGSGREIVVAQGLTAKSQVADSAGLTQDERIEIAAQRFTVRKLGMPRVRALSARGTVILADDILTTGATLRAAAQALAEAGIHVAGCAVIAATRRRLPA